MCWILTDFTGFTCTKSEAVLVWCGIEMLGVRSSYEVYAGHALQSYIGREGNWDGRFILTRFSWVCFSFSIMTPYFFHYYRLVIKLRYAYMVAHMTIIDRKFIRKNLLSNIKSEKHNYIICNFYKSIK